MAGRKVALVTGGGRGIGFGIARSLAQEGYDLAICGVRDRILVEDALKALAENGRRVFYQQAEVSNADARAALVESVRSELGAINVLVNNAGVAPVERMDLLQATEESFERVMKINLQGPYFLTQLVARGMVDEKTKDPDFEATVVNVSSISATTASPERGEYCVSKAGLSMATQLWAVRLGEFNIPVYEVRPGVIRSDMTQGVQDKYDRLIADGLCVTSRWGTPEDVGRAVVMLVRGDLAYSTGQVVMVDGGMTLPRL